MDSAGWARLLGQTVVVDTDSAFVYIGRLDRIEDLFVVLVEADAHDRHESTSTKEQYIMEARRFGVNPNRKEVSIRKETVVSVSRLDDVIVY